MQASKQTIVIKIGTSSLINADSSSLNLRALAGLSETVRVLKDAGHDVVLVSSGAVGVGCQRLGLPEKPSDMCKRQALAAVGQVHLMRFYDDLFSACGLTCSQVLLTLDNLSDRAQYNNAANTFQELLQYGVVPVVNENDTVAVEQLRIGDNDTLSAQVATLVHADWLFLLTDVDALYTANPSIDPTATKIDVVDDLSQLQVSTTICTAENGGTSSTNWGTGGMDTKLTAANMATAAGAKMVICQADPEVVTRVVLGGESVGTLFLPASAPIMGHKRWILSTPVRGQVGLVAGAAEGLRQRVSGLCGADVASAHGEFGAGDAVALCDQEGKEVGRGLAEVSSDGLVEMLVSRGDEHTSRAEERLVVDQLNVCLLPTGSRAPSSSSTSQRDDNDNDTEDEFASMSVVSSPRGANSGMLSMGSAPTKSTMLLQRDSPAAHYFVASA